MLLVSPILFFERFPMTKGEIKRGPLEIKRNEKRKKFHKTSVACNRHGKREKKLLL